MSWHGRVVWSEGMFLKPHHFQQQDRFVQHLVQARCADLRPYSWGLSELKIDRQALSGGRLVLEVCRGVLPDGTSFDIPAEDDPPLPLEVPENQKNAVVYLALPLFRPGTPEVRHKDQAESLARYVISEFEVRDTLSGADSEARLQIGKPTLRLLSETTSLDEYTCIGLARVVERRTDNQLVLDEDFIPPCLDAGVSPRLSGFVQEINGLLHHRGEALAGRLGQAGQGGVAEVLDFLLLQLVNRVEPLFSHLESLSGLHPELFYQSALQLAGELATFTLDGKRPVSFPVYRHERLDETFKPVMEELRRALSMVLEQKAVAIPLEERRFGIRVARIADRSLIRDAELVLAVNAKMPAAEIRQHFSKQVKIGPVEEIRDLVNNLLPGIGLSVLPVAPRQIPYHAGFTYFALDRSSEYWKRLETSGGCALQVGGEFPELQLELWAIKR